MNPAEIVALDALELLVVVDNESDTLSSVDKGVPQPPEPGDWSRMFPIVRPSTRPSTTSPIVSTKNPAQAVTERCAQEEQS